MPMTVADLAAREVEIAVGANKSDKHFRNTQASLQHFLGGVLTASIGEKDGRCYLSGALEGGQRIARNVKRNYVMLLDVENGITVDEVLARVQDHGITAAIYTTYSHMKAETEVAEQALVNFRRKTSDVPSDDMGAVKKYLSLEKGWRDAFVDTVSDCVREFREGGVKYVVKHSPMERMRVVIPLDTPYDFMAGTSQADQIKQWSALYRATCVYLDIPFDPSCTDPSRLMYFPRVPDAAALANFRHHLHLGERFYSLEEARAIAIFQGIGHGLESGVKHEFVTPNLLAFLAEHSSNFLAADMIDRLDPDNIRGRPTGDKIEYRCPNEENHTEQKAGDRAFVVVNSNGLTPFWMGCRHATCISASGGDKAWFCDKIFQQLDITDPLTQLDDFLINVPERKEEELAPPPPASTDFPGFPQALVDRVLAARPGIAPSECDAILDEVVRYPDNLVALALVDTLIVRAGLGKTAIKKTVDQKRREHRRLLKEQEREARRAERAEAHDESGEPIDLDTWEDEIMTQWPPDAQVRAAVGQIRRRNERDPRIFSRPNGTLTQLISTPNGPTLKDIASDRDLPFALTSLQVRFVRLDANGVEHSAEPSSFVLRALMRAFTGMPEIRRVIHVPVLSKDLTIRAEAGYDPSLRSWIDPPVELETPPTVDQITDDTVDEAKGILFEAIRDFPFTDAFNGEEHLKIKSDERDEDGFPLPNLDRGRASRQVAFAMMIQPFVQDFIDAPTPAYLIDKSKQGSGAGFLANCIAYPFTGALASCLTLSENEEEVRKHITSALHAGDAMSFIDNIRHRIVSASLAAVLTADVWKDRKLGATEILTIPNRTMWVVAGNDVKAAAEMVRRLVPLRLDAATANPAADRKVGIDFKHPLAKWLPDNRLRMIWAIHVLILNWVRKGCPSGSRTLNSFDRWSEVLGGIMEAAGFTEFLTTPDLYRQTEDTETTSRSTLIGFIFDSFGLHRFKVKDLLTRAELSMEGVEGMEWDIKWDRNRNAWPRQLGTALSNDYRRGTFEIVDPKNPSRFLTVRLVRDDKYTNNANNYYLTLVKERHVDETDAEGN
jgi:hypothetical protein